ncbi:MAG: hypothetical protein ACRD17_12785, partial [Terriglobales bacterium]
MDARFLEVLATLREPDFIAQSRRDAASNIYYRWVRDSDPGPRPRLPLIAAVVRLDYDASAGTLLTAYPAPEKPIGERI